MSLLKTIKPEEARGPVAEIYKRFEEAFTKVPNVIQMYSSNPYHLGKVAEFLGYYSEHPTIDVKFLCYMRMIVANYYKGQYCVNLNTSVLLHLEEKQEILDAAKVDPAKANLPDDQIALLIYTVKVATRPEECTEQDINEVRRHGWEDKHIFDAIFNAAKFTGFIKLIKALKVEIDF